MKKKGLLIPIIIIAIIILIIIAVSVFNLAMDWYMKNQYEQIASMTDEEVLVNMTSNEGAIITIGIIDKDQKEIYMYGENMEDLEVKEYYYEIGSVTKTFTTTLLAKAIEEERADLADPIGDYIPELEEYDYITLEKLVTHTSGIEPYYLDRKIMTLDMLVRELSGDNGFSELNRDELVYLVEKNIPENKDYSFNYSNFGLALVGIALEEIYQEDYKTLMDNYVQEEFGAENTFVSLKKDDELHWEMPDKENSNLAKENSADYIFPVDYYWSWSPGNPILGSGALVSNIDDMMTYLEFQMDGPSYTKFCQSKLEDIQIDDPSLDQIGISMDGVAMAWIRNDEDGIIWHNGGTDNFDTYLGFDPDEEVGVVVLSNNRKPGVIPGSVIGTRIIEERRQN